MKIVHISMGFPIEYQGGITNYLRMLSREQTKNGHEVVIYCGGNEVEKTNEDGVKIKRYNSQIRPFSLEVNKKDNTYQTFFKELLKENGNIYHIHSLLSIDPRISNSFVESNITYIVSLHDYNLICPRVFMTHKDHTICHELNLKKCESCIGKLEQYDFLYRALNKLNIKVPTIPSKNNYKRFELFSRLLKNANKILPVSKKVSEIYSIVSKNNSKVITIGNDTANLIQKDKKKEFKNIINVAFLGSFTKIKGAEVFIELCKRNNNPLLQFSLYGRGDQKLIKKFESVGGKYCGSYNAQELPSILENIHVGAILSIWEDNGPQVVMELINQSIPVLGTLRGGIPDFINKNNGFLFNPDNEINLASAWLDSLTPEIVKNYYHTITPLKTPEEHYFELNTLYNSLIIKDK